jgi:DNA-binding MarR family transcriptional regulator
VLLLAIHNYSRSKITVKQLFSSIPHSYSAIRKHYKRLLADEWIELYSDASDKRIKFIRPTAKFISTMNQYAEVMDNLFIHKI